MTQLSLLAPAIDEPVEEKDEQIQCRQCGKWIPEEKAEDKIYCCDCYQKLLAESKDDRTFYNTIVDIHIYDRIKRDLIWDLRNIRSRLSARRVADNERHWHYKQAVEGYKQRILNQLDHVLIDFEKERCR